MIIKLRSVHSHDEFSKNFFFVDSLDIYTMIEQVARFNHVVEFLDRWSEIQKCNLKFLLLPAIICNFIKIASSREKGRALALEEEEHIFVVTVGTEVENLVQFGALAILNCAFHRAWYYEEPLTLELII